MNDTFLHVFPMTKQDGQAICSWKYAAPYHIYNWPSWKELLEQEREFADEHIRAQQYFSVKNNKMELIAFFQLFPLTDTIRLGVFVHPQKLNMGYGKIVCQLAVQEAKAKFAQPYIDLEVAHWNKRAIYVYEQCNFTINDEYELFSPASSQMELVFNMVYADKG